MLRDRDSPAEALHDRFLSLGIMEGDRTCGCEGVILLGQRLAIIHSRNPKLGNNRWIGLGMLDG